MNLITKIFPLLTLLSMHSSIIAQAKFDSKFNTHGKQLLQQQCTLCHQLNKITGSSGYTLGQWQELISTMTDLSNHPERELLTTYLATYYPPNQNRQPTLRAASLSLDFKEWVVPTLGQRSRDPIQASDGSIWWAGQWGNLIGKINPKTGAMKEYPLPAGSMPHSVTLDNDGNVWYTGNKNATVGKLNPHTEAITVYKMPDPMAKDPHTAIFDKHGTMWFTLQHSNMLGRLIPSSGDIELITLPTPNSRPYGIKLDAKGNPWVACNGSNCLIKVNPQTLQLKEYKLPDPKSKVRRLDFANDGQLWFVNSSQGRLGRFNPSTEEVKEWPSPSGPKSHPYAIAVIDDVVWYNESGMRPDTLVRFDPQTEIFQSWPIPSGNVYAGIIRHMRSTHEGNLLIHQSSTNRIILVTLDSGKERVK
ncbi:Vgb family protein [Paraglaciecola arctica]|uniref:Vgb family protein n=1 Tax=Paraglaciecola arctica TaxID=1128911 RepID=UPI002091460F|nr:cytochrome C [Paraglaciecola arctica]